jgi:CBS domain-containing membrane protein
MSKDVVVIRRFTTVLEAWSLMMKHQIKALPVVNDFAELEGILTLHDVFISEDEFGQSRPKV